MNNSDNVNQQYICEFCKKEFNTKYSLGIHKQSCVEYLKSKNLLLQEYECNGCHKKFTKFSSLRSHASHCDLYVKTKNKNKSSDGKYHNSKYWNENEMQYVCECGKSFTKSQSICSHFSFCLIHKKAIGKEPVIASSKIRKGDKCNFSKAYLGEEKFQQLRVEASKKLKAKYAAGQITPSFKGRKHKEESKQKLRESMCNWLMSLQHGRRANYNPNSIPVIEQIGKQYGWNFQHALNEGEFYTGNGYFVDAYDKTNNIVLEYDEPKHYLDIENNILKEKDIKRQNEIINFLGCQFYRYNEKTKQLWKVEN